MLLRATVKSLGSIRESTKNPAIISFDGSNCYPHWSWNTLDLCPPSRRPPLTVPYCTVLSRLLACWWFNRGEFFGEFTLVLLLYKEGFVDVRALHAVDDFQFEGVADGDLPAVLLAQQTAIHPPAALCQPIGTNAYEVVTDVYEGQLHAQWVGSVVGECIFICVPETEIFSFQSVSRF
jgi:hypothetical protein